MAHQIVNTSRARFFTLIITLCILLLTLVIVSLSTGSSMISPLNVLQCLAGVKCDKTTELIVGVRFTRTLTALLAGSMLALAGVLVQGVSRNPLADPFILGVSSTALAMLSAALLVNTSILAYRQLAISIAFVGALSGYFLTTFISLLAGGTSLSLVLSGIAVSALFSGASHVLLFLVQDKLKHPYVFLLMGSTGSTLRDDLLYLAIPLLASFIALFAFRIPKALNAYLFGDLYAAQLGYKTKFVTMSSAFIASLLTGASVAVIGVVGFLGLAGPHISRMLSGTSDHRITVVLSALTGSILAVSSDTLARLITAFSTRGEMPLGVVTSIIGAPFLAYLVVRGGRK